MTSALQRWEYAFVSKPLDYLLIGDLNELGQEGWEVISISYDKDLKGNWSWTAFLKRPLSETGEPRPRSSGSPTASAGVPTSAPGSAVLQGFDLPEGDFDFKEEDKDQPGEPKQAGNAESPNGPEAS